MSLREKNLEERVQHNLQTLASACKAQKVLECERVTTAQKLLYIIVLFLLFYLGASRKLNSVLIICQKKTQSLDSVYHCIFLLNRKWIISSKHQTQISNFSSHKGVMCRQFLQKLYVTPCTTITHLECSS